MLMHDLNFGLKHFVLLVRFPRVIGFSLKALHLGSELALGVLRCANIVDGWKICQQVVNTKATPRRAYL